MLFKAVFNRNLHARGLFFNGLLEQIQDPWEVPLGSGVHNLGCSTYRLCKRSIQHVPWELPTFNTNFRITKMGPFEEGLWCTAIFCLAALRYSIGEASGFYLLKLLLCVPRTKPEDLRISKMRC